MANTAVNFENALVFIYDDNNVLIARTSVTKHNPDKKYIEVTEGLDNSIEPKTRLQILIVHPAGACECSGMIKGERHGVYRIQIYDERQRDVRVSVRRTVHANAVISDMINGSEAATFNDPVPVVIENMSTTGILIRSGKTHLEVGSLLQIELKVEKKTGILYGEVLREQKLSAGALGYGCQLHFFDQ